MSAEGRRKAAIVLSWSIFDGTDFDETRRDCEVFAAGWLSRDTDDDVLDEDLPSAAPQATAEEHYAASSALSAVLGHCERRSGQVFWDGFGPELRSLLDGTNRFTTVRALSTGSSEAQAFARSALERYANESAQRGHGPDWPGHTAELRARAASHHRSAINAVEPATSAGHLRAAEAFDQLNEHLEKNGSEPGWAGLTGELRMLVGGTHQTATLPALTGTDPAAATAAARALKLYLADLEARRTRPGWLGIVEELTARADAHRLAYAGF